MFSLRVSRLWNLKKSLKIKKKKRKFCLFDCKMKVVSFDKINFLFKIRNRRPSYVAYRLIDGVCVSCHISSQGRDILRRTSTSGIILCSEHFAYPVSSNLVTNRYTLMQWALHDQKNEYKNHR